MKYLAIPVLLLIAVESFAVIIEDVKVNQLYIQSKTDSESHALRVTKEIDSTCSGRLSIDFEDKELISTLLAYKLADKQFDLMYETGSPQKTIKGHLQSSCRVFSIY